MAERFPTITSGYVHTARYSAKKGTLTGDVNRSTLTIARRAIVAKKKLAKKASKRTARGKKDQAARALEKLAAKGVAAPSEEPVKRGPGRPRKNAETPPAKRGPGRPRKVLGGADGGIVSSGRISGSDESQLAALIVKLGTGRAQEVFDRVKSVLAKLSF